MNAEATPIADAPPDHHLSLIVPVYNEQDSVDLLIERIHEAMRDYGSPWELVIVDDGSLDATATRVLEAIERYGRHVRLAQLQRNFGQTAAMQAGIDLARGNVICTLDGDLQNDPADIPAMVARLLNDDLDLVVGWRRMRRDKLIRTLPSRMANRLIGRVTGVRLHDYGCSLKVYRTEVIANIRLYGEMHRFIPAWVAITTHPGRIAEMVVNHHPRSHGQTKYGLSRTWRVLLDLVSVYFFMRYRARPGHFFGSIGLVTSGLGGACVIYLMLLKLFTGADIGDRPLLLMGVLLVLVGIQFLTTGVLAEMGTRTYYEATSARPYIVRESASRNIGPDADWRTRIEVPAEEISAAPPDSRSAQG